MRIIINKDEMRKEWSLNRWFEKTIYVIGLITTILFGSSFTIGFIAGIWESIK